MHEDTYEVQVIQYVRRYQIVTVKASTGLDAKKKARALAIETDAWCDSEVTGVSSKVTMVNPEFL